MKRMFVVLLFMILLVTVGSLHGKDSRELVKVENLSEREVSDLRTAKARLAEAKRALSKLQREIKKAHGASWESWMEWSGGTVVVLDGKMALIYKVFNNHMDMVIVPMTED